MNSQFPNGHPPSGPRPLPTGPQGTGIPSGQYVAGPMPGKAPYGVPPGLSTQPDGNVGPWDPSYPRDVNGLPREPYNPQQLPSDFGSMQIGDRPAPSSMHAPIPGHQWSQNSTQASNHSGDYTHGSAAPPTRHLNQMQPLSTNAFQPQIPGSNAFQPQRSAFYPSQSYSNAFLQQPPMSQAYAGQNPPPSNFPPPQGFPPMESSPATGPPVRGALKPQPPGGPVSTGGSIPSGGPGLPSMSSAPPLMSSIPAQFPPGSQTIQGPPSSQWGPSPFPPQIQQNAAPRHPGDLHAYSNPPHPLVTSQPYSAPPPPGSGGFPASGFQGQRKRFPGPLPDGSYSGAPGFNAPPYLGPGGPISPPQNKRLELDQMPSQIQVTEDDEKSKGGCYQTGQRGNAPPLVTTNFYVEDLGLCSPRFFRASMYNIPCSKDLLNQSHLPVAVALTPFARLHPKENPPPIVDLGQMGPVRCNRCKAYMCPLMIFVDGGRKFQCCFCNCLTEVPPEYFAHLDHTGRRIDCYDRPELCLGAYEFVATIDYCTDKKLPQPPAFIFMIDVSFHSMKNGLVNLLCARLKNEILNNLPKDIGDDESEVRVGFVTYARELHFYNIKGNLNQPQMLVVSDINDVFIPLVDGFLVKPSEAEPLIDSLLSQIPQMFSETQEREPILGPVIQAGLDALKSSERVGKLFIFHTTLPSSEAPGKLKAREDKTLLGTDKEKTLLTPQTKFYTKLGQECLAAGCSVDIFLFPTSYVDVASIAEVPRLTGGNLYKYNNFQADLDGEMLLEDLRICIERQVAFNATLKLRTSAGTRSVDFLGNFFMENTTEVELASLDRDKCINIEIKHDDKLNEAEGVLGQAVVLYTTVGGRRRLRILNMAFNCCTQVADLYRFCELDVLVNHLAKQAIRESLNSSSKQVKEQLTNKCVQTLAYYRKNASCSSSSGQLILPECMKLLPLYINSILKSTLFQSENINVDDRSYYIHLVNSMSVFDTVAFFYPRLLPLHELDLTSDSLPSPIRCTYEKLKENGAYLLENGLVMFLWVGLSVSPDWIQQVFGCPSVAQVDIDKTKLQELNNPLSVRVRGLIKRIREERRRYMKLIIVRPRDRLELVMQNYLVEDKSPLIGSSLSYVEFLCHIHKEIRNLLL